MNARIFIDGGKIPPFNTAMKRNQSGQLNKNLFHFVASRVITKHVMPAESYYHMGNISWLPGILVKHLRAFLGIVGCTGSHARNDSDLRNVD